MVAYLTAEQTPEGTSCRKPHLSLRAEQRKLELNAYAEMNGHVAMAWRVVFFQGV